MFSSSDLRRYVHCVDVAFTLLHSFNFTGGWPIDSGNHIIHHFSVRKGNTPEDIAQVQSLYASMFLKARFFLIFTENHEAFQNTKLETYQPIRVPIF